MRQAARFSSVLLVFLLSGCVTGVFSGATDGQQRYSDGRTQATQAEDNRITAEVREKIYADHELSDADIRISTRSGVVSLSGRATSDAMRERARSLALAVDGVRRVEMNITLCGRGN